MRGRLVQIVCPVCKKKAQLCAGAVNRASKVGMNVYCSRKCSGIGRRVESPTSPRNPNWKAMKEAYDREYRIKNAAIIKAKKAAAYKIIGPKNRDKERDYRQKRMPAHLEYCRQPQYRVKKEVYDRVRRAKLQFGDEFADAFLVLQQIESEISVRIDRTEIYRQNGTLCKSTQRKRDYERKTGNPSYETQRNRTQRSAVVNPQRDQN